MRADRTLTPNNNNWNDTNSKEDEEERDFIVAFSFCRCPSLWVLMSDLGLARTDPMRVRKIIKKTLQIWQMGRRNLPMEIHLQALQRIQTEQAVSILWALTL
uniref:Uncharacterized protein n=1 Tax=Davidia involucrata TaxID=16924 RepID=A0A5B6ZGL7_DAVIN